jgi:hypothetical protein
MSPTEKIDLCKLYKEQYSSPKQPVLMEVPRAKYLAITGSGEPGGKEFSSKIGALYGMAYTIKMTYKFSGKQDYTVCKLEALYWLDGDSQDFSNAPKELWNWKFLIRTPDFVNDADLESAVKKLLEKGKEPEVKQVKLESFSEGLCVQALHIGPYDRECEMIEKMMAFADKQDMEFHGLHHEIYLSDPRRVPSENLKTILRMPVRKKNPGVL